VTLGGSRAPNTKDARVELSISTVFAILGIEGFSPILELTKEITVDRIAKDSRVVRVDEENAGFLA
jgi:hypothetical protein